MIMVRNLDGTMSKFDSVELPRVFNAVPAKTFEEEKQEEEAWSDSYDIEEETPKEEEIYKPVTKDETFDVAAYMTVSQDEPLPEEAIISEDELPTLSTKKKRRR